MSDNIKTQIYSKLTASSALTALVPAKQIHPAYMTNIPKPIYPCITICLVAGGMQLNRCGSDYFYHIDVWTKGNNDSLWSIYKIIRPIMFDNIGWSCREDRVCDDLYEQENHTNHLSSTWKIFYN